MPIVAESDPIRVDVGASQEMITPAPVTSAPTGAPGSILERHRLFVSKIDASPACFTKGALVGFSDDEFALHLGIAKIDKYVVEAGSGMYCSKAAVEGLSKSLERLKT